jgi:hypothetical protein
VRVARLRNAAAPGSLAREVLTGHSAETPHQLSSTVTFLLNVSHALRLKMRDPSISFRNWLAHLFSPCCIPLELKRPAMAYETCLCLVTNGNLWVVINR